MCVEVIEGNLATHMVFKSNLLSTPKILGPHYGERLLFRGCARFIAWMDENMLACNIFLFITNTRGWIFNQIWHVKGVDISCIGWIPFPPTMLDSYWNIPWEIFYLDKDPCLVCTGGPVGTLHPMRLLWGGWKILNDSGKFRKEMNFPNQEGIFLMSRSSDWF